LIASIKTGLAALASTGLIAGGIALGASAAQASSDGCAFSNGCATLHGTDANGNTVAMDAKYQNKTEILIGYPDNAGDGATSFDGVVHFTHARSVRGWSDTGLTEWTGRTANPQATVLPTPTASATTDPALSVSIGAYNNVTGCLGFTVAGGTPFGPIAPSTTPVPGYQASLSGLNAAAAVTVSPASAGTATGTICINGDNLTPAVYHSLVLTVSDNYKFGTPTAAADPESASVTFAAEVHGYEVTTPGNSTPFYTFVFAPHGDWTSQCVTDENGSGALKLEACTLGHNVGQDFTIDSTTGLLDGSQHHVSNLLAAAVSAKSCLVDNSTLAAGTPQSDATDEGATGRQLRVDGSCAANTNLWSWGS
jgi:hypothetical protein